MDFNPKDVLPMDFNPQEASPSRQAFSMDWHGYRYRQSTKLSFHAGDPQRIDSAGLGRPAFNDEGLGVVPWRSYRYWDPHYLLVVDLNHPERTSDLHRILVGRTQLEVLGDVECVKFITPRMVLAMTDQGGLATLSLNAANNGLVSNHQFSVPDGCRFAEFAVAPARTPTQVLVATINFARNPDPSDPKAPWHTSEVRLFAIDLQTGAIQGGGVIWSTRATICSVRWGAEGITFVDIDEKTGENNLTLLRVLEDKGLIRAEKVWTRNIRISDLVRREDGAPMKAHPGWQTQPALGESVCSHDPIGPGQFMLGTMHGYLVKVDTRDGGAPPCGIEDPYVASIDSFTLGQGLAVGCGHGHTSIYKPTPNGGFRLIGSLGTRYHDLFTKNNPLLGGISETFYATPVNIPGTAHDHVFVVQDDGRFWLLGFAR